MVDTPEQLDSIDRQQELLSINPQEVLNKLDLDLPCLEPVKAVFEQRGFINVAYHFSEFRESRDWLTLGLARVKENFLQQIASDGVQREWAYGYRTRRKAFRFEHDAAAPASFLTVVAPYRGPTPPNVRIAMAQGVVGDARIEATASAFGAAWCVGRDLAAGVAWCRPMAV